MLLLPIISWTRGPNANLSLPPLLSSPYGPLPPLLPFLVQTFSCQQVLKEYEFFQAKASNRDNGKESSR